MESPLADEPHSPRRRGWLVAVAGALALILCVCVVAATLGPLALTRLAARTRAATPTVTPICPSAAASDSVPGDPTGQFTVQPVYAEALAYAHDAEGKPKSQRVHLWSVDVLGQYPPMDDIFTNAVGGVDQWNTSLSAIDPAAFGCVVQDMQSTGLADWALSTLHAAAKEIPGPKTTAYLVPWNTNKFYGASGEQSLLIPFWEQDPLNRGLTRNNALDWFYMPGALDHEYLEVVRYARLGSADNAYQTLLDNMVTDGLADNFSAHMTGSRPDWGIGPSEEATLWARFEPTVTQYANADEASQMLGDPAQGIPNAAGYAIGDHIVALYIQRHPSVTFDQLAGMDAQTIYAGSDYTG
ncbi:MAG TPA: DUF2268 domain-containing putative Zn-dependent protease [Ktedonobacterales bacterium]|jgi:hypothetical protein|nr:DUF2268 domain-containing putative Zn-dependent protease [Ktedonobacterales bacterium]